MSNRTGAVFTEGTPNPKRTSAKKVRGFGMGQIGSTEKAVIDAWAQGKDPLFKVKGIERHLRMKGLK